MNDAKPKLYTNLAKLYDELYPEFFDYESQADLVDACFRKFGVRTILEVGCGTGRLAHLLAQRGYSVNGLDTHKQMLEIARRRTNLVEFFCGDIRDPGTRRNYQAIVCMGKTFAHFITNEDVESTLKSCNRILIPPGLLLFDSYSAQDEIRNFEIQKSMKYTATLSRTKKVTLVSESEWYLKHGLTQIWKARYIVKDGRNVRTYNDRQILRSFFRDELETFLKWHGFVVLDFFSSKFAILARKDESTI